MRKILNKKEPGLILLIFLVFSFLLENIKLITVLGAPVKLSHIIVILSIIYFSYKKVSVERFVICFCLALLPLFPLYRIIDKQEWFKSYVIWLLIVSFFCFAYPQFKKTYAKHPKKIQNVIIATFLIAEILGIVQFLLVNFLNVPFLIDSFGVFQFHKSYYNYSFGYMRCFSVFHEPSVLGWGSSSFIFILIYWKNKRRISKTKFFFLIFISLLSIVCSISASALYFVVVALICDFILHINYAKSWGELFFILIFAFFFAQFTNIFKPMQRLFTEVGTSGTSGYERISSPIAYALETIKNYPFFGRGIGQDEVLDAVGHIPGTITSTVNNSLFEIIQNFGLSALVIFSLIAICVYSMAKNDLQNLFLIMSVFCVFICTGAYLSMDYLTILVITLINSSSISKKSISNLGKVIA